MDDAMSTTHPMIENSDPLPQPKQLPPPAPPPRLAIPPILPPGPPQQKPESAGRDWEKIRWKGAIIGAVVAVAIVALWTLYQITSITTNQMSLSQGLDGQLRAIKATNEKIEAADKSAKRALDKADTLSGELQTVTADVNKKLAETNTRVDHSSRDIAKLTRRLDAIEKHQMAQLPRVTMATPSSALPPPMAPEPTKPKAKPLVLDPHHHDFDSGAPVPAGTIVVNNQWILSNPETHRDATVIPFDHNASGTLVHNIQDGKHYLIDKNGNWIGKAGE